MSAENWIEVESNLGNQGAVNLANCVFAQFLPDGSTMLYPVGLQAKDGGPLIVIAQPKCLDKIRSHMGLSLS